jgi:hypothetical protein
MDEPQYGFGLLHGTYNTIDMQENIKPFILFPLFTVFLGNLDELVLVAYSVPLFLAGYDYFKNFLGGFRFRFDENR